MENRTAAITIEVDDDQFKRFHALFQKYQAAVGEMPAVWKDAQEGSEKTVQNTERTVENTDRTVKKEKEVTKEKEKQDAIFERIDGRQAKTNEQQAKADRSHLGAIRDMIAALTAHNALIAEEAQKQLDIAREQDRARAKQEKADRDHETAKREQEKKAEDAIKRQNHILAERQKGFKAMGETLTGMIGSTMNIGLNIAKWGIGAGIGLLGGGIFGLDRLAGTATAERTRSRGLGVSPGELRAWRTEFGNYGDPEGLLTAASNAPTDAVTRSIFQRAGVNDSVIRGGNTSQIAEQALKGLSEFFRRNQGPNAQAIWSSRGYDQIIGYNQMRQFAAAPASERAQMFQNIHRDIGLMGSSDPEMKAWQDFYTQLQRSGQELKTTFLDGLVKLSGPIGDLSKNLTDLVREFMKSDGFKEIITTISQGLRDLSDSMKNGSFKKGLDDFTSALKKFSQSGELQNDLKTLEQAIHITAESVGWLVRLISKSPRFGGTGWGDQKMQSDGNGNWHWVDNPENKGFGFSELWDWIKNNIGPSQAHADTLGASRQYGMERYLNAIAKTESGGNPYAVSKAGAQGLFQLMPSVQRQYGVTNPFDPEQSRRGASALIADLFRRFNGDPIKATAAYNAGGGRVSSAIRQHGDDWLSYLPMETQQYVGRVAQNFQSGGVNIRINNVTGGAATVTASQARSM